ncbi:exocyst complex component EXO84A [Punica granatum]|uniref:Exocyst component Exo84 C-terminal domain-containing protein n=2 Tax=Punica granatum TaxID=22663 RepID=A0A218XYL2_PUNGR|nr:exocyst complex component EXO84A [Punica granatum]OWM89591.1 hypothetical protein CDL15_Pgr024339 [Punica granatum]PKI69260.1 hypothetical protein CRG98_010333 [Punica granatum]
MTSLSRTSFSSSKGDSMDFEADLPLSDRLKIFKSSRFEPDGYVTSKCQSMTEKEIKHLRAYLVDLKKASAEEMRKSVYANYGAFIRTSREITDLEGQLLSMRNLLSTQGALVHGLAEGVRAHLHKASDDSSEEDMLDSGQRELSNMEKWLVEFLENLEVLLAERRVDEALAAFDEGDRVKVEATERGTLSLAALLSLQNTITEQRQKLADQLAEMTSQPSTRGPELRSAVLALKKLGDGPRAHSLLLASHHKKLHCNTQGLRSQSSSSCGGAFAAALSQLVFSTIAQTASDSLAVFGEEPAFTSELVTWAVKEAEAFAGLLKRRVLASAAASGSLRVAAECVHICLGHCSVLEARGLALSPVLLRLFRPCIEQALTTNLKRIEQNSAALAAADTWSLAYTPVGGRPSRAFSTASFSSTGTVSQPRLSSSAHKFNSMVQEFLEDVGPLESLQLEGATLEGLIQVFSSYVNLLINALPSSAENEDNPEGAASRIVRMAETEAQQIGLLANASLLADELLPRAAMKLMANKNDDQGRRASDRQYRLPEQREWKKRLQRSVDRLRDSFCRQHALELIFTEDGDIRLNSQMYTTMDDFPDEPEWFPSPIFQELFLKLSRMASFATDMFVGRERFATILLMRLTETVILWLSDDQAFWEDVEQGPKPLGPLGLRQFYLDMEFVILFSSQGRYLSRHLHQVIKNIIERAIESIASTGIDPYSVLPEEEWFAEVAQIAIKMLSGKANFGMERDVVSPTAKSISSVVSHGSN